MRQATAVHTMARAHESARTPKIDLETRRRMEAAVEWLLAMLDDLDGDPDLEPGGDDEPSLGAPNPMPGIYLSFRDSRGRPVEAGMNQVLWAAGGDDDREVCHG